MRPDQKDALDSLTERLIDVFLVDSDPDEWSGAGITPSARSTQERGNRAWDLKNAKALANIVRSTMDMIADESIRGCTNPEEQKHRDDELDRRIQGAEARAKREVDRVLKVAQRKPAHGI